MNRLGNVGNGFVPFLQDNPRVHAGPEESQDVEYLVVREMNPEPRTDADEIIVIDVKGRPEDVLRFLTDLEEIAVPSGFFEGVLEPGRYLFRITRVGGIDYQAFLSHHDLFRKQ